MTLRNVSKSTLSALCMLLSACAADTTTGQAPVAQAQAVTASATFLVVYKLQALPLTAAADIAAAGGTIVAKYPAIGVIVAQASSASFVTKLQSNLWVDGVAPTTGAGVSALPVKLPFFKPPATPIPAAVPNAEPLAALQWNMVQIHAAEARAITPGKKSVIVGVLDSGIDDTLPDLQGQVDHARSATCIGGAANTDPAVWSNDVIGHGTHVAGIIGAKQNGVGTVGIAPGATLAAVKLSEDGFIYPESVVCGLNWAATHGFDLVNASLFVDPWYYNCPSDPTQKTIMTAIQRSVAYASLNGVTVIAAASNEQQDLNHPTSDPFSPTDATTVPRSVTSACKLLPVQVDNVIGVSAVGANAQLSYYSNYGLNTIDFAAPGGDLHNGTLANPSGQIVSPIPAYSFLYQVAYMWNGRVAMGCPTKDAMGNPYDANDPNADTSVCPETYALLQGTSQATPHVTGVAALVLSRYGKLPTAALVAKLQLGATHTKCPMMNPYQPYPADMAPETCENGLLGLTNGFYGAGEVDAYNSIR